MTFIQPLFSGGSPAAVRWLVVAVVVFALYCHAGRASTHVCEEVGEIMPSLTDADAATSPISIIPPVGVFAALNHANPRIIFRAYLPGFCVAVLDAESSLSFLSKEAAAAFRVAGREGVFAHNCFGAAVAPAQPEASALAVAANFAEHGQSAKDLINHFGVNDSTILF